MVNNKLNNNKKKNIRTEYSSAVFRVDPEQSRICFMLEEDEFLVVAEQNKKQISAPLYGKRFIHKYAKIKA